MTQKTKSGFRKYEDSLDRRANRAQKIYMQRQKEAQLNPHVKNGRLNISLSDVEDDYESDLYDDLEMEHQQH